MNEYDREDLSDEHLVEAALFRTGNMPAPDAPTDLISTAFEFRTAICADLRKKFIAGLAATAAAAVLVIGAYRQVTIPARSPAIQVTVGDVMKPVAPEKDFSPIPTAAQFSTPPIVIASCPHSKHAVKSMSGKLRISRHVTTGDSVPMKAIWSTEVVTGRQHGIVIVAGSQPSAKSAQGSDATAIAMLPLSTSTLSVDYTEQ